MQVTTHPAWPTKTKLRMTLDCSRIAKEIMMMSGRFVEGRRQTLLYSCKRLVRMRHQKNLLRKLVNYCPKEGDHKQ